MSRYIFALQFEGHEGEEGIGDAGGIRFESTNSQTTRTDVWSKLANVSEVDGANRK